MDKQHGTSSPVPIYRAVLSTSPCYLEKEALLHRGYTLLGSDLEGLGHNLGQVNNALGVAPLVVVPGDNLDHVITHNHGEGSVNGGGDVSAAVVNGDKGSLLNGKDSLHGAVSGLLEGGVNLLSEGLLLNLNHKVHNGHVGGGHAESNAVELALQLGQHKGDSLGGTGGGGHNGEGGGTGATEVAVGGIQEALVAGVRVGGGHGALDNSELLIQDLDEGSKAVGGAGGVGDDVVGLRVVVALVDTNNVGGDVTLAGGSDDNLLGASLNVLAGALGGQEHSGSLNDDVNSELSPGELGGVAVGHNLDDLVIDGDVGVVNNLDVSVEDSEGGVVLEQVGGLLDTAGVVDGDNLEEGVGASVPAAEEVAANAAESVDGDLDLGLSHDGLAGGLGDDGAGGEHLGIGDGSLQHTAAHDLVFYPTQIRLINRCLDVPRRIN